ncbi:MAG TPA: diaminopimelate epimerase [Salinimicrobium sp.]|nr:diaminopimelate epimerase [Salinimicrobium sp.]
MGIEFFKYQGTGNDFVIIDNRRHVMSKNNTNLIKLFCDRKFGVGADGLILLEGPSDPKTDFAMVYFNADGKESSMCGNGGRCIVSFAAFLGIIKKEGIFSAVDGLHQAMILDDKIFLRMKDVPRIEMNSDSIFVDTGSPHHVIFTDNTNEIDVKKKGALIRYSENYSGIGGVNVNFVESTGTDFFNVRTYERGVEDETLSCGTGVTAVALAASASGRTGGFSVNLSTPGGELTVSFEPLDEGYTNIWLSGPAEKVFKGVWEC